MADRVPGQTCQATKPVNVKDGTSALCCSGRPGPVSAHGTELTEYNLSPEIGSSYLPVPTTMCLDPVQMQVLAALRSQFSNIVQAEQKFRVDRRAIAGAIAWEMLENPMTIPRKMDHAVNPQPRSVGWAKVHLYNFAKKRGAIELLKHGIIRGIVASLDFQTIAKETEEAGYLPKQTFVGRRRILSSPEGAITYVAAIMAAIADVPEKMGFEEDIRSNPMVLTNVYQGETLKSWNEKLVDKLKTKGKSAPFIAENTMGVWVEANLPFLEEAVGAPDLPESAPGFSSMPSGNSVVVQKGWTLSGIAKAEYGDEELWPLIYDVNKTKIGGNPNLIQPGMILSIRPLTQFSADEIAEAKKRAPTWKKFK